MFTVSQLREALATAPDDAPVLLLAGEAVWPQAYDLADVICATVLGANPSDVGAVLLAVGRSASTDGQWS